MKRIIAVMLALCPIAFSQTKNPVTSVVQQILPRQEGNLTGAVEAMPADKFSYKPTPQQMSFGKLVVHVIESDNFLCSKIGDISEPKIPEPSETDSKEKLAGALKASFDFCKAALDKVDDSKLGDTIELHGGRQGPRALAMIALTNDWADHYSAAAMYLRLNGILPPSAQKK